MAKKKSNKVITPSQSAQEKKWQAEDAYRTIKAAEQYKQNPSLMKRVTAMAQQDVKTAQKIARKQF